MAPERKANTMLRTRLARAAVFVGLVWTAAACTDGLTDINTNPNAPTDVPAQFLLPQAIQQAVTLTFGSGLMSSHTSIWPQHFVQLQYADEEQGAVRIASMDAFWDGYYAGGLKDIQLVMQKGIELIYDRLIPQYNAVLFPSKKSSSQVFRLRITVGVPAPGLDRAFKLAGAEQLLK